MRRKPCTVCNGIGRVLYRAPFMIFGNPGRDLYTCTMIECPVCRGKGMVEVEEVPGTEQVKKAEAT